MSRRNQIRVLLQPEIIFESKSLEEGLFATSLPTPVRLAFFASLSKEFIISSTVLRG